MKITVILFFLLLKKDINMQFLGFQELYNF